MSNIVLITSSSGDWQGLYLKGLLFTEGHQISQTEWLQLIQFCHKELDGTWKAFEIDDDYLDEIGAGFPLEFSDIEVEMLCNV